ncbi:hypothetical protein OH77DRAFT_1594341 [Trametes cingulata]|nr:hypothetical protein OH77DRAFT_1594341 [Trametes cingulata]
MLARLNWWPKSGELPTSTMVHKDVGKQTVRLAEVLSLVADAVDGLDTDVEVWRMEIAGWRILPLKTGELCLGKGEEVVLVRLLGVEHCSNFSVELEMLYQCMHLPGPLNIPEVDLRLPAVHGPFARVLLWQLDGVGPIAFLLPLKQTRLLRFDRFPEIRQHVTDVDFTMAHVWSFASTSWTLRKLEDDIELPANSNTLLVKKIDVYTTIGLGKEIAMVERDLAARMIVKDVGSDVLGDDGGEGAKTSGLSGVPEHGSLQKLAVSEAEAEEQADDPTFGDGNGPSGTTHARGHINVVSRDTAGSEYVFEGASNKICNQTMDAKTPGSADEASLKRPRDDTASPERSGRHAAAASDGSPKRLKADVAGNDGREEQSGEDEKGSAKTARLVSPSVATHDGVADAQERDVRTVPVTEGEYGDSVGGCGVVKESEARADSKETCVAVDASVDKAEDEAAVNVVKGAGSVGEEAGPDTEADVDNGLAAEHPAMNIDVGGDAVPEGNGDKRAAGVEGDADVEQGRMAVAHVEEGAAAAAGEDNDAPAGSETGRAGDGQVENDDEDGSASGSDTAVDGLSEPDDGVAAESDDAWRPFWGTLDEIAQGVANSFAEVPTPVS